MWAVGRLSLLSRGLAPTARLAAVDATVDGTFPAPEPAPVEPAVEPTLEAAELPEPVPARQVKTSWAALQSKSAVARISSRDRARGDEAEEAETAESPEAPAQEVTPPVDTAEPAPAHSEEATPPESPLAEAALVEPPAAAETQGENTGATAQGSEGFEWDAPQPPRPPEFREESRPFATVDSPPPPVAEAEAPAPETPTRTEEAHPEPSVRQSAPPTEGQPEARSAGARTDEELWVFMPPEPPKPLSLLERIIRAIRNFFKALFG